MKEQSPNLKSGFPPKKRWYFHWWVILAFFLLLILVAFAFLVFFEIRQIKRGEIDFTSVSKVSGELEKGRELVMVSPDDDPFAGSPTAKVTIIAFEDFQCPYCLQSFPIIREIISDYGDQIYFVYRDFPLSDIHPFAQKAHEAAECADDQGKFWLMHDKIYQNQDNIAVSDLKRYAQEIGLDNNTFSSCLDSGKYEKEVKKDFTDGIAAGVRGTPTWFINGRKFEGVIPLKVFKQIIDIYLQ